MNIKESIKTRVKYILEIIFASKVKKGIVCPHTWYGNKYGGFYICPDLIDKNSIIYSFGIGEDISFDKAIIENHGCHVNGFDPTPKSINWLKNQNTPTNFHFFEYGISNISHIAKFYLPKNPEYVSGSIIQQDNISIENQVLVQMKSIKDITNELKHKHIDVLKMDIEGAEYDVIEDLLNSNISVTQILIEFHDRFFKNGKRKTKDSIKKLKKNGFEIFAISDSFEEISFMNKFTAQNHLRGLSK